MKKHSTVHASFTIERTLTASPEHVFQAFADQETKAKWFIGPDHWKKSDHRLNFKVGSEEHVSGGPVGGSVHSYNAVFRDIVPQERIVTTYEMHLEDKRISVSVATLEFILEGTGTRLILTEQDVFLDGYDTPESREHGTRDLLDKLEASLTQ
jgi:uncharacterized protein YndB with AHSA1/START domain